MNEHYEDPEALAAHQQRLLRERKAAAEAIAAQNQEERSPHQATHIFMPNVHLASNRDGSFTFRAETVSPEAFGVLTGQAPTFTDPVLARQERVYKLEEALLEARADQVANGDPMPLQDLRNFVGDALRLLEHKNESYGDAWKSQGYMGNLARIASKAQRLQNLLWKDADGDGYPLPATRAGAEQSETVRDTLLDLVNLAAMMAVNWEHENRWGA